MTESEILEFIRNNEPHPLHDAARTSTLSEFLEKEKNESFSEMLFRLIREKNMSEVDVYRRAGITPQHFSKIRSRNDYQPTKGTVLTLAVALRLTLPETKDLLRTAGLAFTHAEKRDIVVEYFIINGEWDIFRINEALDSLSLPLLG
jgi:O-acetyl-ADP-ribose deacetylase